MTESARESDPAFGRVRQIFLNTDLANPTSNGIYQRIGFRRRSDLVHLDLEPSA
jgi:hypothetical protein